MISWTLAAAEVAMVWLVHRLALHTHSTPINPFLERILPFSSDTSVHHSAQIPTTPARL